MLPPNTMGNIVENKLHMSHIRYETCVNYFKICFLFILQSIIIFIKLFFELPKTQIENH